MKKKAKHHLSDAYQMNILQSISETLNIPVFSVDTELRYTSFNKQHAEIMKQLNHADIELNGFVPDYFADPAERVRIELNISKALRGERCKDLAFVKNEFQNRQYYEATHDPIYDSNQKIIGAAVICYDVTSQKQTENKLAETGMRLKSIMDGMLEGCQIIGFDWKYKYLNDTVVRDSRMKREQLLGRTMMECYPGIENTETFRILETCMNERVSRRFENEFTFPDGSTGWFGLSVQPVPEGLFILSLDVSEQRKAVLMVKESEEKFRHVFESANVGKSITLPTGEIDVNKAFCDMLGYTPEELKEIRWQDLTPEDEIVPTEKQIKILVDKVKDSVRFEKSFLHKSGQKVWCDLSSRAIYNDLGTIKYFITTIIDITDRKKAQEELQVSERKLKLFVEYAPAAIAMFDNQMRYIAASRRYIHDYRLKELNIIGRSHYEIFPEIPERWKEIHHRCLAGATEKAEKDPFPRADGSIDWNHWEIMPWYENDNQIGGILLFSEVITDKIEAEERIRKINEMLEQRIAERTAELSDLYNNSPCGYHSLDANGVYNLINDTELRWLGYTREELVCKLPAMDLLTENSKEIFRNSFHRFKKSGHLTDLELDFIRKDGSILSVLLNATAIYDDQGNFVRSRSTMIDHTERKKAEEALKEAMTNLEAANKELESFSYSVSHDLRAPLRAIGGFTRILSENYQQHFDDEGKRICGIIESSSIKMGRLIDDLLAFSRLGKSKMVLLNINIGDVVKTVIDELITPENLGKVEIIVQDLPEVQVDPPLIRQVWINLISNAIKYSSRQEKSRIEIYAVSGDQEVTFSIKDNGIGFDMQYIDKIFAVFQRLHTDKEYEGTGVGLAIVKRIINRHGGRVWAESKPNEGSTFSFTIPK